MTTAPTPGWTGHVAVDSALVMLDRIDCSPDDDARIDAITSTLRQLHAAYQALQTENERLRMELVAEASAAAEQKLRADQLTQQHRMQAQMHAQATQQLAELEARKPLPLSYRAGAMASSIDGGATVSLHFNDAAEAEAWFVAITDQHDAALVDKSPDLQEPLVDKTVKLQDRQRFWGFFHSTCIYESDAELISLHATKAGAWRAMHRAQWLAWEEVRTLQMAGRREPGWKAYVHEASRIGLVEVQP